MNLEYARKTIYGRIDPSAVANRPVYSFREIRDEFRVQFPDLLALVDCMQLLPGHRVRLSCTNEESATLLLAQGLSFRNFPVALMAAKFSRTVRIHRLPFEMDPVHIRQALNTYGEVESLIRECDELYTGVLIARMTITKPIPSKVTIRGQHSIIIYKGQIRTCFTCGSTAHENRTCPQRRNIRPIVADTPRIPLPPAATTPSVAQVILPETDTPGTPITPVLPMLTSLPLTSDPPSTNVPPLVKTPQPIARGTSTLVTSRSTASSLVTPQASASAETAPTTMTSSTSASTWITVNYQRSRKSAPHSQPRSLSLSPPAPWVRKRTHPAVITSSQDGKTPRALDAPSNSEASVLRDRSPLGFRVTESGGISYADVVTRETIPNPPYRLSPEEELLDDLLVSSEVED